VCERVHQNYFQETVIWGEEKKKQKGHQQRQMRVKFGTTTKRSREKITPEKMQRELLGTQSRPTISSSLLFIT
jgi:hypothetical protein